MKGSRELSNLTYAQLCAMPDADQLRDERMAIMVIDGGLSEEDARAIVEQHQLELWQDHKKGWKNELF